MAAVNELYQHLARLRWTQQQWTTPRWCARRSAETRGARVGTVHPRVEGATTMRRSTAPPRFRRGCPKRRRDAWPRPGFTLEKGLIFPGDASPALLSRAVAAEKVCRRDDESAGKRRFALALPQDTAAFARISGSNMPYSTTAGEDCYWRSSQGGNWRTRVGRPATTAPIDQGSERRARPQ